MSYDDQLAEQQLRRDMGTETAFSVLVELLGDSTNQASTVAGPTGRKRHRSATVEEAPSKPIKVDQVTRAKTAAIRPEAIAAVPKKLGRPKKLQQIRQGNNNNLAAQKVKGDIYEVTDASPQKSVSRPAANTKTHRSGAKKAPEADQSDPAPNLAAKKSLRSTVPSKDQESHSRNEGVVARQNDESEVRQVKKRRGKRGNLPTSAPTMGVVRAAQREGGSSTTRSKKQSPKSRRQPPAHESGEEAAEEPTDLEDAEIPRLGQGEVEEEADAQSSEYEDSTQVGEGDSSEVEEEQMDLLGHEEEWEKVLKSARSVPKIKFRTENIKKLRKAIIDARLSYRQLLPGADMDSDALEEVNEQLQGRLDAIETHIKSIAESKVRNKESETVADMFGRAIPSMVLLLDAAFNVRAAQPRGLRSFHAMKEIVRLQDMTIELCEKARLWDAGPRTDQPIIKPTTSVIYPYIRDMRKVFSTELVTLRRKDKIKHNARITAQKDKERFEHSRREAGISTQQSSQRGSDRELLFRQDREREEQQWRKSLRRSVPIMRQSRNVNFQPTQRNGHVSPNVWTEAEMGELAVQLGNETSRHLPLERRYLAALNTPLLQNMLPEHIREKALSLKPFLISQFGPAKWICDIE